MIKIIKVVLKIKKSFFFAIEAKIDVVKDFSVSFTIISLLDEKIFNNDEVKEK